MMNMAFSRGVLLVVLFLLPAVVAAEDWPGWRGPRGDGTSDDARIPEKWDGTTGENIAWKTPLPGEGYGSPIVRAGRIFLVTCLPESQERALVCLDAAKGSLLWQQTVVRSHLEVKHNLNSYASSTPAAGDDTVYVAFLEVDGSTTPATNVGTPRPVTPGQIVVAAYDFSGKQKWLVRPGVFTSVHGFCSNPVLYRDLVIINGDHDGESYITALSHKTGETVWKQPRPHKTRSYVTPLIRDIDGEPQLVFSGSHCIVSLDPRDGSPRWNIEGPTEQYVASMVYDGRQFYMVAGYPTYHALAIRPDGKGNVTKTHVTWHATNLSCYVPSPVVVGKYLLVADDRGTANCFETEKGARRWQTRLGSHYSASLINVRGHVHFTDDDGITKIVEPGEKLQVIAENRLGERCFASPAVANSRLFLRGEKHLFCIADQATETGATGN